MARIEIKVELIDIHIDPIQKKILLKFQSSFGEYQIVVDIAEIPYDNETERQEVISKMEKAAKHLQDLQQWQEKKLTTKR